MQTKKIDQTGRIKEGTEHKELQQKAYSIHYYLTGKKENPPLVLLHSAFADHRCFDKQIDFFSEDYRIITIDLLGHGLSRVEKTNDRIDQSDFHIASILQIEGYDKAHIAGVSMGSLIAQHFALNYPDSIISLTAVGGYDISTVDREISRAQRSENFKWIWKAMISMDSFRQYVADVSVDRREEKRKYYEMAGSFTRRSFHVMTGLENILKIREPVKREYPLFILVGERDTALARRIANKWHTSEPGSLFNSIENAGHCANMDEPEVFNEILMDFLKKYAMIGS